MLLKMTVIPETDSIVTLDSKPGSESRFTFTTVPGYFLPDLKETDPAKFDYVSLPAVSYTMPPRRCI